jgi:hypothetical protein
MDKHKFMSIIHILQHQRMAWQLKAAEAAHTLFYRRTFGGWFQEVDPIPKLVSSSSDDGDFRRNHTNRSQSPSDLDYEDTDVQSTLTPFEMLGRIMIAQLMNMPRR